MKLASLDNIVESEVSHNPAIKKRVMIGSGEITGITQFSQAVFPPGAIANSHSHRDMTEVFFIESGRGVLHIDGTDYPLSAGSCITVEPGEHHELRNCGDDNLVVSYFGVES